MACHNGSDSNAAEKKTANARIAAGLLDDYVGEMKAMVQSGRGTGIEPVMVELGKRCDTAHGRGEVDDVFHRRFGRLVQLVALIVRSVDQGDPQEVEGAVVAFVTDVQGADRKVDPQGGLAAVSEAIVEELLSLYEHSGGPAARKAAQDRHFSDLE